MIAINRNKRGGGHFAGFNSLLRRHKPMDRGTEGEWVIGATP
jgi:hypothetical protein